MKRGKMRKIYLPSHKDGGNRGCEAITRGTAVILEQQKEKLIAYSNNMLLDESLGLKNVVCLNKASSMDELSLYKKIIFRIKRKLINNKSAKQIFSSGNIYKSMLKNINSNDIALSTGGDMFCYGNNEVIYINNYLHKRHVKTVLWGCSIGKENLTPEKVDTLKKFSLVTVRESLTKKILEEIGLKTVRLFPDPAFVLSMEKCDLPLFMHNNEILGLNLSNFVGENVGFGTLFGKNLLHLIDDILEKMPFDIVLIPHVFWKGQDDRIICNAVYERYKESGRVHLLNSDKLNYCQIRYVISKCRFFLGARTHSVISAYSTCVPSIALGYSIKARGIARDLGLPDKLVVDCKNLKSENTLLEAFSYLISNEKKIRLQLERVIPDYRKLAYDAKKEIDFLLD